MDFKPVEEVISSYLQQIIQDEYNQSISSFEIQPVKKGIEGDFTIVLFPLVKLLKVNLVELGNKLTNLLNDKYPIEPNSLKLVNGFLNFSLSDSYYLSFINHLKIQETYGHLKPNENSPKIMVEYSSPNTNKPLHLGHIRNNLLGYAVAKILEANGKNVLKTQIINDRGIHICKSMVAWKLFGDNKTPSSEGIKGDKFVGDYYVLFDKKYREEIEKLINEGVEEKEAKETAPILLEAQKMLQLWEQGDEETISLWKKMNDWVYEGFGVTYTRLGVSFDSYYYESETYLLGKEIVAKGLKENIFFTKDDNSTWVDCTNEGLDEKLLLRSDGTSVYITQDLGTAYKRAKDVPKLDGVIYTVGNEQNYHFKTLFTILKKLNYSWAENLYHLSYGMVNLPDGKMKSREGKVIDADDLIDEMENIAKTMSEEHSDVSSMDSNEKEVLYNKIGLGALKYFILKVDPKKEILFNPKESIDFSGDSASFIQYTYARIQSILRIFEKDNTDFDYTAELNEISFNQKEKEILKHLYQYPKIIKEAGLKYSPSLIANYVYDLAKLFNSFYQHHVILSEENNSKITRVCLSKEVGKTLKNAFGLLGIEVPNRM